VNKLRATTAACLAAGGVVLAPAAIASANPGAVAAPVPDCFPDYGYTIYSSGPSEVNTYEYFVTARELPFASGATVYLTINGNTRTGMIERGYNARTFGPFTSPLGADVYMSIYQAGDYHVCAGTSGVPGPPAR